MSFVQRWCQLGRRVRRLGRGRRLRPRQTVCRDQHPLTMGRITQIVASAVTIELCSGRVQTLDLADYQRVVTHQDYDGRPHLALSPWPFGMVRRNLVVADRPVVVSQAYPAYWGIPPSKYPVV